MDKEMLIKDMIQANTEGALIRKAYNEETWEEFEKCTFAFFPGCMLGAAEPEMIIKAYDSIRFQYPDTGIFLYCCGIPAKMAGDEELLEKTLVEVKVRWESLGKPTLIMACPGCYNLFTAKLPEIPMVSFYKFLQEMEISGGCNSADYFIKDPATILESDDTPAAVRALAEDMGAKLHETDEEGQWPYLVYSIKERDALKRQGKDAVHILELIYGMGASNVHLEHEHEHDHDDEVSVECSGECSSCSSACGSCGGPAIPAPLPTMEESQQNRIELKQAMLEFFFNEF